MINQSYFKFLAIIFIATFLFTIVYYQSLNNVFYAIIIKSQSKSYLENDNTTLLSKTTVLATITKSEILTTLLNEESPNLNSSHATSVNLKFEENDSNIKIANLADFGSKSETSTSTRFLNKESLNLNITHHGNMGESYATVVSMYFQLDRSKHNPKKYDGWLSRMFQYVKSPIIFFTNDYMNNIIKLRENITSPITFIRFNNIWEILNKLEIERNQNYTYHYKFTQHEKDPEKHIHNPNLYAIWNLKSYLVNMSATLNFYNSSFFIYGDSGAWRDGVFRYWPDISVVKMIHNKLGDKFLSGEVGGFSSIFRDSIEGTFFAGSQKAIREYSNEYYRVHDERLNNSEFVGKDQTNMNIVTYQTRKDLVARLRTTGFKCSKAYNRWFFFQYFFASNDQYVCDERESLIIFS